MAGTLDIEIEYRNPRFFRLYMGALSYICAAVSWVSLPAAIRISEFAINFIVKRGLKIKVL